MRDVCELVGAVLLVLAAFLVNSALGFAAAGLLFVFVANFFSVPRGVKRPEVRR